MSTYIKIKSLGFVKRIPEQFFLQRMTTTLVKKHLNPIIIVEKTWIGIAFQYSKDYSIVFVLKSIISKQYISPRALYKAHRGRQDIVLVQSGEILILTLCDGDNCGVLLYIHIEDQQEGVRVCCVVLIICVSRKRWLVLLQKQKWWWMAAQSSRFLLSTHTRILLAGVFQLFHKNTTTFSMQLKSGGELICALPVSSGRSYAFFS